MNWSELQDVFLLIKFLWPHIRLYSKQRELIQSVEENRETFCVAGNMLGKDFTAGLIVTCFFLRRNPCRIVTTSCDGQQLEGVLWGEMRRFLNESRVPLTVDKGGPIVPNHLLWRKVYNGTMCGLSYVRGRVAQKGEGMLGHHIAKTGDGIPRTLFVADEASGVDDLSYERATTWANRVLVIGNPYPCYNFFKKYVKEGDIVEPCYQMTNF